MRSRALLMIGCLGLLLPGCAGHQKDDVFPEMETGAEAITPEIPRESALPPVEPEARPAEVAPSAGQPGESVAASTPPKPAPRPAPAPRSPPKKRVSRGKDTFDAGVRAVQRGDLPAAEGHFLEAVTRDEKLEWGWYNLGLVREHKGDLGGAKTAYKQALEIRPDFAEAAANLTALLLRQGKVDEAERELRRRIAKFPAELELRNLLAGILVVRRGRANFEAAFTEARKVLKADERNVGAMIVLGQIFYEQGKLELAGSVLDNAAKIDPGNAQAHNLRGFVFLAQKERDKAFLSFKKAAELRPDFPEAHINYGAFLNQSQSFGQAVTELELAVQYAPKMATAHLNLGNAYRGAGEHKKALAEYHRVQELDPRSADALFNLGLLYLDAPLEKIQTLDRLKKARDYFKRYKTAGGRDERVGLFIGDADKAIKKEERRMERERKASLRKAKEEAEAARTATERASSSRLGDDEEDEAEPERSTTLDEGEK